MTQDILLKQAVSLHQQNKLAEAEKIYRQILAAEPGNFDARYLFARLLHQQNCTAEALQAVEFALKRNPHAVEALNLQGVILQAAGRHEEALACFGKLLALKPDHGEAWFSRGIILGDLKRPEEALAAFHKALTIRPDNVEAWNHYGDTLQSLMRFQEALMSYDRALAINPGQADVLNNRGNVLQHMKCFEEALASYDMALATDPNFAEVLNNRGSLLQQMKHFEEALASYDKVLAIKPYFAEALNNRGITLRDLMRLEEALASYDKALAIKPDFAEALNNRGNILLDVNRLEEALASYDRALFIQPDFADALNHRGKALFESNRIQEGLLSFMRSAALGYGQDTRPNGEPPHKIRHDQEQQDYLAARGDEPGALLATAAVRPDTAAGNIAEQWQTATPQIVVIDNFLTDTALEALRRFCLGAPVWRKIYSNGYLGALPEGGFACPLLGQIAEEMRGAFPAIFRAHPLRYLWAFKYDSNLSGINVHADEAAVNVNFWITPDEANLDPDHGGLIIWDKAAPLDWDFEKYNIDNAAIRDFLEKSGAKSVTVPYRANRAVIFDSDLFHETDKITFRDGYLNRRINVTLLFGRRESDV